MDEDIELIVRAKNRIADEARWTTRAYARTNDGTECDPNDAHAVAWSAVGALIAETPDDEERPYPVNIACADLIRATSDGAWPHKTTNIGIDLRDRIQWFNDTHTHKEVIELFERTLKIFLATPQS